MLPRNGVEVTLVDPHDLDAVRPALPGAALFHVETIANPNVTVADLEALGAACRDAGVPASVDNTFASPYLCTPARFGFDYVCHSATKYVGGHHDLIAGVVCTSERGRARLRDVAIDTGGTMAPFEAWLCLRGLMTLAAAHGSPLRERDDARARRSRVTRRSSAFATRASPRTPTTRSRRGSSRAGSAACWRSRSPAGSTAAQRFCDALELAWVATSLGGTHTLVGHAASTTHRQMDPEARRAAGIADGLVRVSVGIEDADDILDDFERRWRRCERPSRVAVVFGGRSAEHEISCISARSVMDALDPERFEVVPVGITKRGRAGT